MSKEPFGFVILESISAGIVCGVGFVVFAMLLCAITTGLIVLVSFIPSTKSTAV